MNDLSYENCFQLTPPAIQCAGHLEGRGCGEGVDGRGMHQGIPQDANACLNGKSVAAAKIVELGTKARTIWQLPANRRPTIVLGTALEPLCCIGTYPWRGATTYRIHRVGHTKVCASEISERVDPLNNLEAGRRSRSLIGWLVLIELVKAPHEPLACEGWCRRGLWSERSAGAGVGDGPSAQTDFVSVMRKVKAVGSVAAAETCSF